MNVEANATSSTTVVVRWGEVPHEHCNGQIEGFKVSHKPGFPRNFLNLSIKLDIDLNLTFFIF